MNQAIKDFELRIPKVQVGGDIESNSLSIVEAECINFDRYHNFKESEKEVIKRLIHTSSCFKEVIENIFFTGNAIGHISSLLQSSAKIIVDTNMIKSGLSKYYTDKHSNHVVCHVSDERVIEEARKNNTTRTYSAVKLALSENFNQPTILACGNAPTFIYSAIESLVQNNWDMSKVALLAFPVGFVNVVESKDYANAFFNHFNAEGIVMNGRFGSSTMIVAALHAIYRLI